MDARFYIKREYQDDLFCNKNYVTTSHLNFHSPLEVWVVLEGRLECWINGNRKVLCQGEMIIAFSYDTHGYRALEEKTLIWTLIVPLSLCGEFREEMDQKQVVDPVIRDAAVFERVNQALEEMKQTDDKMIKRGFLYVALGTILNALSLEERQERVDQQLSTQLLCYLKKNFKEELSLQTTAEALGYHPAYLSHYFTEVFHTSFSRYVTMLRLRESVLLMQEGKSLSECAYESGFGSLRTFHRVFRKEFQCTPKNYIKQIK